MRFRKMILICVGLAAFDFPSPSRQVLASEIKEYAIVVDGGSLLVRAVRIRLAGIDALELGQRCVRTDGVDWACGLDAKRVLTQAVGQEPVSCRELYISDDDQVFATCTARSGDDLSAAMVRSGHALARGSRYLLEEDIARQASKGMWSGSFETPWEWRAKQPDCEHEGVCEDLDSFGLPRNPAMP